MTFLGGGDDSAARPSSLSFVSGDATRSSRVVYLASSWGLFLQRSPVLTSRAEAASKVQLGRHSARER